MPCVAWIFFTKLVWQRRATMNVTRTQCSWDCVRVCLWVIRKNFTYSMWHSTSSIPTLSVIWRSQLSLSSSLSLSQPAAFHYSTLCDTMVHGSRLAKVVCTRRMDANVVHTYIWKLMIEMAFVIEFNRKHWLHSFTSPLVSHLDILVTI